MGKHNIKNKDGVEKKKKKKKKSGKILKIILLILLIIVIGTVIYFVYNTQKNGGGVKGFVSTVVGQNEEKLKDLDKFNFLLLGDNQGLTDSIMVCTYDPKTQEAAILSIPRDTFIGTNKNKTTGWDKINSLYQGANPEKVMDKVSEITGVELEYYVVVETDALIELVDALGGVEFDVPIDMKYDDPAQDLHIDLEAGLQLIDGPKAEQLLRFRHNNNGTSYPVEYGDNDYGRMRTQREFIMETVKQTLKVSNIFKITQFLGIIESNVKTNIDFDVIKDYIPYVVDFSTDNLETGALPGVSQKCNGVWVFLHDPVKSEELIQDMFFDDVKGEEDEEASTDEENTIVNEI